MNTWCLFCLWDRRKASILTRTDHTGCLTLEFHPLELGGVNNPVHSTCVAAWLVKTQVLKASPLVYLHLFPHLQSQNDRMVMSWCCLQTKWSDNKYATCSWFDRAIPSMTGLHGHQSSSFQTGSLSIPLLCHFQSSCMTPCLPLSYSIVHEDFERCTSTLGYQAVVGLIKS